jgi:hypothetical protein
VLTLFVVVLAHLVPLLRANVGLLGRVDRAGRVPMLSWQSLVNRLRGRHAVGGDGTRNVDESRGVQDAVRLGDVDVGVERVVLLGVVVVLVGSLSGKLLLGGGRDVNAGVHGAQSSSGGARGVGRVRGFRVLGGSGLLEGVEIGNVDAAGRDDGLDGALDEGMVLHLGS